MSDPAPDLLVIGSTGQLGQDLLRLGGERCRGVTRAELDLEQPETIYRTIERYRPAVVINAAAYNFVDRAEDEPDRALATNAIGPLHLARACTRAKALLVHISTDYVFGLDRGRNTPYREDDLPGPVNCYGVSKLTGEYFARQAIADLYVLRTCGVYGLHGRGGKGGNFVETILRLASERKELKVVNDQRCTPTFSEDLARAILELVRTRPAPGVFHVTNGGDCSWYEFAVAILESVGSQCRCVPISSDEYPMRAKRPRYSVLDTGKWKSHGLTPLRHWREALAEYLAQRRKLKPPGTP